MFSVWMAANRLCMYGNTHCMDIYKNDYTAITETGSSKRRKDFLIVKNVPQ